MGIRLTYVSLSKQEYERRLLMLFHAHSQDRLTIGDIAKQLNYSRRTVRDIMEERGYDPNKQRYTGDDLFTPGVVYFSQRHGCEVMYLGNNRWTRSRL